LQSNIQGIHDRNIYCLDWNDTGIITGAGDNMIRLLVEDKESGWVCKSKFQASSDVNSVCWAKCGTKIAAGTDEGEIVLLNVKN
jgi:WD40 repeat protein